MKYGARNQITAKVTDVKRGDVMSLVKFEAAVPAAMASRCCKSTSHHSR